MSKLSDTEAREAARQLLEQARIKHQVYLNCETETAKDGKWVKLWVLVPETVPASVTYKVGKEDMTIRGQMLSFDLEGFDRSRDIVQTKDPNDPRREAESYEMAYSRLGLCKDGEAHDDVWGVKSGGGLQAKCKHCGRIE